MNPNIHIQILAGPDAGVQKALTDPRIGFGRAAGNAVVIDDAHVSRQHGELAFSEGQWYLINRSPNGSTVNGRRIKDGEPRLLKPGDVIGVGKTELLAVQFTPAAPAAPAAADQAENADKPAASAGMSRRSKLWIGIAVYLGVLLLVFIVLSALRGSSKAGGMAIPPQLDDEVIRSEILRPMQVPATDEREAASHLLEAQQLYPRINAQPDALYKTYRHYKLAMAYSGKKHLEGLDQLQFNTVEQQLIKRVINDYRDAYAKLRSRNWADAGEALRRLTLEFPDSDTQIFRSVESQRKVVNANTGKRGGFFR